MSDETTANRSGWTASIPRPIPIDLTCEPHVRRFRGNEPDECANRIDSGLHGSTLARSPSRALSGWWLRGGSSWVWVFGVGRRLEHQVCLSSMQDGIRLATRGGRIGRCGPDGGKDME